MTKLMLYGATGYTGRLIAAAAKVAGTPLILAGRSQAPLAQFATELGLDYRVFGLDDATAIDAALAYVDVIINAAGPFMRTASALMQAAIRSHVHYIDVAAELDSYQLAETLDEQAKAAGVMLMPGGGGSVAMLGSLAAHAVARVTGASRIRTVLHVRGGMSRGSAISATENVTTGTLVVENGQLVSLSTGAIQQFDFGHGPVDSFAVTLPDLITIGRSTGVADIETFVHVTGGGFPQGDLAALPDGPTEDERLANRYQAAIEVTAADGQIVRSRLDTVNGYSFAAMAAAEAGRRALGGAVRPGFQTPVEVFGGDFALSIGDTTIVDL